MSDEEIKAWMRSNREGCEDGAQLAEHYCSENDALDDDGEVPDEVNALASEVWAEGDEDSHEGAPDDDDCDGAVDEDEE